jgi:hypothetical protein
MRQRSQWLSTPGETMAKSRPANGTIHSSPGWRAKLRENRGDTTADLFTPSLAAFSSGPLRLAVNKSGAAIRNDAVEIEKTS